MNPHNLLPDGTFNGVEVVWIILVVACGALASYATRRHVESIEREQERDRRRIDRERSETTRLFDAHIDEMFGPDSFALTVERDPHGEVQRAR
jgi:hypothetical protein